MAKKMTRKQALETTIEIVDTMVEFEFDEEVEEWYSIKRILENMIAQIDKQAARPKTKSSARLQNENHAKIFIAKLQEKPAGFLASAKWMSENIPYVMTSQKAVAVAKIAEEWGAISRVVEGKRTYYVLNDYYEE